MKKFLSLLLIIAGSGFSLGASSEKDLRDSFMTRPGEKKVNHYSIEESPKNKDNHSVERKRSYFSSEEAPEARKNQSDISNTIAEGAKNLSEKIPEGLEVAPKVIDTISTALEKAPKALEKIYGTVGNILSNRSYFYMRVNVSDAYTINKPQVVPGVGLGYRFASGSSAIDLSASYTRGKDRKTLKKSEFITLPRISYFFYPSPLASSSAYAGAGLAYGKMKVKGGDGFQGIMPSISLGYEISRSSNLLSFLQLDLNQPVIAANPKGSLPGPVIEFSFGAGF